MDTVQKRGQEGTGQGRAPPNSHCSLFVLAPLWSRALRFTAPLFWKAGVKGGLPTETRSLTLSCTGLEAHAVWQQIPTDFCSY